MQQRNKVIFRGGSSKTNLLEWMSQSESGYHPIQTQTMTSKVSHPFTHFSQLIHRAYLLSLLSLDDLSFKPTQKRENYNDDDSLIHELLKAPDGQFLHLFVLYFKGPGFPLTGTWTITAWKWPNCVCAQLFFPTVSCPRVGIIIPLCIHGMLRSQFMRSSRAAHLALCRCNEHEQAVGPGVGVNQETSLSVFPLTASGPLGNQTRCGGRDPGRELRDALQAAGPRVKWELAPVHSARETLAMTHRKPIVSYSLAFICHNNWEEFIHLNTIS